ncbi:hypothetical protein FC70_GL001466 [Paucilactobacillus oligofermentans DSM 15707 = LMG 22743]|uniref:DUF308 domain-containing protein n=1 Tax=Paucilactobacillus oligofermentans DSM 15707 = LMG 22743 TaxID=1423778 RepID=A0A0R1RD34_9LACO|nr:hypothetical protein [Paucilactobacillus oligofermentans]KRL54668.1 hypothetical protein FC70_GL001466 [Paucilactobacillus oligofermentans DSM 15707 = LMG 22743]CUS26422.1 Putative transmembrane receptor, TarH-containing [Paucilactobacillus oligofermentans DSM 15707 = LMG 22743]
MIIFVIIGGLMLIMSVFYLLNSIQRYGTWAWATFMTVLSVLIVGIGILGMWPKWTGQEQTAASQASSESKTQANLSSKATTQSSSDASSIAATGKAGLTGQTTAQTTANTEKNVLAQLKKNFKTFGSVKYDETTKTYLITPTESKTVESMNYIIQNPSNAEDAGWSNLTGSILKISKQLKKITGNGYSLTITQPDSDEAMFTVKDGITTYDIANQ